MGFMTGVWRMLGAIGDEVDEETLVEYPVQHGDRHAAPAPKSAGIIDMPRGADASTLCFGRPLVQDGGQPAFSMKAYAGHLLNRQALILDVNELAGQDVDEATRLVDYLSGVVEAVDGTVWEVSKNIFLFAPRNIGLSGDELKQIEVY
jgi:FtsZ-interacting cell division protein YlmF